MKLMKTISTKRHFHWVLVVFCSLALAASTFAFTQFNPVEKVLSINSWGAGVPNGSCITAFATFRPWWIRYTPNPVVVTASGGIEPQITIPRDKVAVKFRYDDQGNQSPGRILPERGIGYEAILGGLTALRSLFSTDLIFDFALFIRLQQWALVGALIVVPLGFYGVGSSSTIRQSMLVFTLVYLTLLILNPNINEYLNEGIIDSSLANPAAVLSCSAWFFILKFAELKSFKEILGVSALSLGLSFSTHIRGEFLIVLLAVFAFNFCVLLKHNRLKLKGLLLALVILFSLPVGYGLINTAVFGRFIPLRMHFGQNLYEPIGQFPNPWGIEYRDEWLINYVEEAGYQYGSFEDDTFLTRRYLECLKENPGLFLHNFNRRLQFFSTTFGYPINFLTLFLTLIALGWCAFKDEKFLGIAQPLLMALGFLAYFGWVNSMLRCVTPVHFLINLFWCLLAAYLYQTGHFSRLLSFFKDLKNRLSPATSRA